MDENAKIKYSFFDPTKNYTILVESPVDKEERSTVAKKLMKIETKTEQVGFINFDENNNIHLHMAGGEFCGNATMCAGLYVAINDDEFKKRIENINDNTSFIENNNDTNHDKINKKVFSEALNKFLDVSVEVISNKSFTCSVKMPRMNNINKIKMPDNNEYTIVNYDGISHIIIENDLNNNIDKTHYEKLIKTFCDDLNVPSLGIIFYDDNKKSIKPLIYVKNADTLYWENSCASGSIAVYEYLLNESKLNIPNDNRLYLKQPCDDFIEVFMKNDEIYLQSVVNYIYTKEVLISQG